MTAEPGAGAPAATAVELAERIKTLKSAHSVEAKAERTATRCLDGEEPVTTGIRRRSDGVFAPEPQENARGTFWRSLAASRRDSASVAV